MNGLENMLNGNSMSRKYLHVSVGNLNVDITIFIQEMPKTDTSVFANDLVLSPGGSASNYAVAVAFYGHRVSLVATTSINPLVNDILSTLKDRGVDVSIVKRVEGIPGIVVSIVTENGEKRMFKYKGVNEFLSPNDIPLDLLKEANIVHLTSISPNIVNEVSSRAQKLGILVSYDPGVYAIISREKVLKTLDKVNILFLNRVEAKELAGTNTDSLLKYGLDIIAIKKGAGGAYVIQHNQKYYYGVSKPILKPINTTGAGDVFDAFFNASYLDYRDVCKALLYALSASSLKTSCRESIICFDKSLLNKQLRRTIVEVLKNPDEWVIED